MGTEQQGKGFQPMRKAAVTMNGITVAYMMGLVNAVLATLLAFGVNITVGEQAALAGLVNASLILAVHLSHRLGEVVASGADTQHSQDSTARLVADLPAAHQPPEVFPGEAAHGN